VNDLTADEDKVKAKVAAKAAKQQLKAQEKVRQRLNAERKGTGRAAEGENEEGDENISTFAKGGRGKQKKK